MYDNVLLPLTPSFRTEESEGTPTLPQGNTINSKG